MEHINLLKLAYCYESLTDDRLVRSFIRADLFPVPSNPDNGDLVFNMFELNSSDYKEISTKRWNI